MEFQLTLAATVGLAALAAVFGWLGARPANPTRGPRLVPWRLLMTLCAAAVLMGLVHLVNLAGFHTGR